MAQIERTRRSSSRSPRTPTSPTFEQLLQVEDTFWSPISSPTSRTSPHHNDQQKCMSSSPNGHSSSPNGHSSSPNGHSSKKSVLTKVKERAKKLKHSLSGKKKHGGHEQDDNTTSDSVGAASVTMVVDHDDQPESDQPECNNDGQLVDDDPEYLGAPMYESEAAPEALKESARQHPRAVPVVPLDHVFPNRTITESAQENEKEPVSPNMTLTEAVSEKLAPAYAAVSEATHKIASKLADLTVTTPQAQEPAAAKITEKLDENWETPVQSAANSPQKWDKGVSVKEYLMSKLEQPRDDEKELSQALTEAVSPRKTSGDTGVVEKVKEAVTSFFWNEDHNNDSMSKSTTITYFGPVSSDISSSTIENCIKSTNDHSSKVSYASKANTSPVLPVSSNAHEVIQEENHGKILQAN